MEKARLVLVVPALCGLLAACDENTTDVGRDPSAYDSLEAEAERLMNEVEELSTTDPTTLPTTGGATYEGVMQLDVGAIENVGNEPYDLAGDMELSVNFANAGNVVGTAGNFVSTTDEAYDGTLTIDQGFIDRVPGDGQNTVAAIVDGELTGPDGTAWDMIGFLGGEFAGEGAEYVSGGVSGGATPDGGESSSLTGDFVGVK